MKGFQMRQIENEIQILYSNLKTSDEEELSLSFAIRKIIVNLFFSLITY